MKFLSFCFSCRMAILAVLFSFLLFLPACPGEEKDQCFGPSGPVECMDIPYKDSHTDGVTDDSDENVKAEETELSQNPCEGYEMMNGTFDCCGENGICYYDLKCEIKNYCKAYCVDSKGVPHVLNGASLLDGKVKIVSSNQFYVEPSTTTCTK